MRHRVARVPASLPYAELRRACSPTSPGVRVGHWTDEQAPHRLHGRAVPRGHGRVGRGARRRARDPRVRPARPAPHRESARRRRAVRRLGVRPGRGRRRDAVLEERGIGFPTAAGPVPIVVGARRCSTSPSATARSGPAPARATPRARPRPADAPTSSSAASAPAPAPRSASGRAASTSRPGGIGAARVDHDDVVVAALVAVNASATSTTVGDAGAVDRSPRGPSTTRSPTARVQATPPSAWSPPTPGLDKRGCLRGRRRAATTAWPGRSFPPHTTVDGDALVAAADRRGRRAERRPGAGAGRLRRAVERAIRSAGGRSTVAGSQSSRSCPPPSSWSPTRRARARGASWPTPGRTQVVFGMGDPHADLMFVGEGPGAEEDRQGLPFVGRSGKLLDQLMLEELGVTPRPRATSPTW